MIAMLLACRPEEPPPHRTPPTVSPTVTWVHLPAAPLEPVVGLVDGVPAEPVVEDAGGAPVAMEPGDYGWVAVGGFAPGDYRAIGLAGVELDEIPEFTVRPFGTAPLDASGLVGRAWRVTDAEDSGSLADLARTLGDVWLRVDAVDGAEVEFRLVADGGGACIALRDRGTWDAGTATLSWAVDHAEIEVPGEDTGTTATVEAWDGALGVAWLEGDDTSASGSARGTVATHNLEPLASMDPGSACLILGGCSACPDGSGDDCFTDRLLHVELAEDPEAPDPQVFCGIDRLDVDPIGPLSCEWDAPDLDFTCGCHEAPGRGALPLVVLVGLIGRRRSAR